MPNKSLLKLREKRRSSLGFVHSVKDSRRFFTLIYATACATVLAAGAGVLATLFLHGVENLFTLSSALSALSLSLVMAGVGLGAGLFWWALRSRPLPSLNEVVREERNTYPVLRTSLDAALQIFVVGAGASIGRETAPRQFAGVLAHRMSSWIKLSPADRSLLTAVASGAALGAVYNTPLAGIAYSLCIVLGAWSWLSFLLATTTSIGATLLARLILGSQAFFTFPTEHLTDQLRQASTWGWVFLSIPLLAVLGWIFKILGRKVRETKTNGARLPLTIAMVLGFTGMMTYYHPAVAGNGVLVLEHGFAGDIGLTGFLVLLGLKPLLTLLTLRAGVMGGLLAPALALGSSAGGAVALALGYDQAVPIYMVVGAAGVLAVSENSLIFGSLFMLELIHAPWLLWPAVVIAVSGGVLLVRYVESQWGRISAFGLIS